MLTLDLKRHTPNGASFNGCVRLMAQPLLQFGAISSDLFKKGAVGGMQLNQLGWWAFALVTAISYFLGFKMLGPRSNLHVCWNLGGSKFQQWDVMSQMLRLSKNLWVGCQILFSSPYHGHENSPALCQGLPLDVLRRMVWDGPGITR